MEGQLQKCPSVQVVAMEHAPCSLSCEEGQLHKFPLAQVVTAERAPRTLSCREGHARTVGFIPKVAQGRTANASISSFRATT
jgi:hypothetical protein